MTKRSDISAPVLGALIAALAISGNFLSGFLVGLLAPVAAIAGIVAGIRLATGKVPFLGHTWESEDGERHLSLKLVSPDEAQELYAEHKERLGDELGPMKDEIKAVIEEAKAPAQGEVVEEGPEVAAEE
ncbi:hypothetical protein ACFLWA_10200 [Chloroflexota bacterium]